MVHLQLITTGKATSATIIVQAYTNDFRKSFLRFDVFYDIQFTSVTLIFLNFYTMSKANDKEFRLSVSITLIPLVV